MWRALKARLERLDADPARFDGVRILGVDERVSHHVDQRVRGPKMLTEVVDLSRDEHGRVHARLLDLVPGRGTRGQCVRRLAHPPRRRPVDGTAD